MLFFVMHEKAILQEVGLIFMEPSRCRPHCPPFLGWTPAAAAADPSLELFFAAIAPFFQHFSAAVFFSFCLFIFFAAFTEQNLTAVQIIQTQKVDMTNFGQIIKQTTTKTSPCLKLCNLILILCIYIFSKMIWRPPEIILRPQLGSGPQG